MKIFKKLERIIAKTLCFVIRWKEEKICPGASVYDVPDIRDYAAPRINPSNIALPEEFCLLDKVVPFKWKAKKQSKNSCSSYSKKYQEEILNTVWDQVLVNINGEELWRWQEQTGGSREKGDTIQNSQKQFKKHPQGFPVFEYFRLKTSGDELIHQMKLWIYARFCPIQTGGKWRYDRSRKMSNFSYLKQTGEYEPFLGGTVVGAHAFDVVGWTKTHWIIKESELEQYGDQKEKGVFLVKFEYTGLLFSKLVVKDAKPLPA